MIKLNKLNGQSIVVNGDLVEFVEDMMMQTSEEGIIGALAAMRGRAYTIPDDIKELFLPALRHRVVLTPSAHIEGNSPDAILRQVLQLVPAPR